MKRTMQQHNVFMLPSSAKRKIKYVLLALVLLFAAKLFGLTTLFFEKDFHKNFRYPYDGPLEEFIDQLKNDEKPMVKPINSYPYPYIYNQTKKCVGNDEVRLVYLVKSAPEHFNRRIAIRESWGFEKRFSDVEIRRVFLLGYQNKNIQSLLDEEQKKFGDLLQANFTDSYFNNTIKTMIGLKWAYNNCKKAKYFMLTDDDYYVSTKNVLRYLRNPANYPAYLELNKVKRQIDMELPDDVKLYTGFVFNSKPHRHVFSKWFVNLNEYPYDRWPPYVTAGAVLFSRSAMIDMYLASFYTHHFRFDDIYLGLLALKTHIEPFHSDEFHYYKKSYSKDDYRFTVASHGFLPGEMLQAWNEQKSLGNA